MDGKNSSGRRVSLLNDSIEAPHLVRLPSITPSLRSRTSSYTSSSIGSPPTPRLIRSDSSDSVTMQTPSPITPEFGFDTLSHGLPSPNYAQQQYFDMPPGGMQPKSFGSYAPVTHPGPLTYHGQSAYYAQPQMAEQHLAPAPAPANARPKKNSYPCPMAKQYQCSDYFTTSGHAARHAKKHTGKKDAYCPECNKAFTRKDNMEQHRRTHQSGRSAKGSENGVKKPKPAAKRPRPSPLMSSEPAMSLPNLDPTLSVSPVSASFMAPAVQQAEPLMDFSMQQRSAYPDPTQYSMSNNYSSSGLDALAIAASGEKRKWDV
ncbi:uncharacterized protein EKO05_0001669 [Ascochyta rabiei]|uniref:C2H2 type master regulator of conidiophore development brlA n=1 Tax=Didymella rabiei TaxID=5454 RepID=A0A163BJV8_DIDRA|nr:uncharacterized protein EKO05_0001669 [Ascochyta rabiei]KZM21810.1 metal ion binding [Ascochyta rabiei]UPX11043.1 hypothetical protein EKO05_0001669 [Ascochyta rabiei]